MFMPHPTPVTPIGGSGSAAAEPLGRMTVLLLLIILISYQDVVRWVGGS